MSQEPTSHDARPAIDVLRETLATDTQRVRFDHLLALLETDSSAGRVARVEATVGVVGAARDADRAARIGHQSPLAPDMAQAVDRWADGASEHRLDGLVTLLELPFDDAREDRIARTLEFVQSEMDRQSDRLRLDPSIELETARRRFRLADLGAIAAAFVILASIAFPTLSNFQANTWAAESTANLQRAGFGSALFAADHDAKIPYTQTRSKAAGTSSSKGTQQWWLVGDPEQSHSANLYALISGNYVPFETLNAPGKSNAPQRPTDANATDWRDLEQVSYSYRLFSTSEPPTIFNLNRSILITDRSPVVRQAIENGVIDASENSDNFNGKGQHAVYGDASVVFLSSPVLPNGDNIWLPKRAERSGRMSLRGDERPESPDDQFVGP